MSAANKILCNLSDYALELLPDLQQQLGCSSRSELIELLILSQVHTTTDAWSLVAQRPSRGRRWPVVVPDDFQLPPEAD